MSNKKIIPLRYIAVAIVLAALSICPPSGARAQSPDTETVRGALERTAEVIAEARMIIEESRSNIARLALQRAVDLQSKASEFLSNNRSQFAYKYTMEARREAWHAIALARQEARIEDRLVNISENARERLLRLRERVMESGIRDQQLTRMMSEAREQLENAHAHAQQLRNQLAMNFAENAERLSRQAENRFRKLLSDRDMVRRRLVVLGDLAERARERFASTGGPADTGLLAQAEQELARAREMMGEGRYEAARMSMEHCERLLRGIARAIGAQGRPDAEGSLEETERLMERAHEMIRGEAEPPAGAMERYEQAERLMLQARQYVSEGKGTEAGETVRTVRRLLREAVDMAGRGGPEGSPESQIDGLIRMRDEVREIAGRCGAEGAMNLFERADQRLGSAMDHFEAGRMERARVEARIARNLFRRIREICED